MTDFGRGKKDEAVNRYVGVINEFYSYRLDKDCLSRAFGRSIDYLADQGDMKTASESSARASTRTPPATMLRQGTAIP